MVVDRWLIEPEFYSYKKRARVDSKELNMGENVSFPENIEHFTVLVGLLPVDLKLDL